MISETDFNSYVKGNYNGSSKPLNYPHLRKGCLLQFGVKLVLDTQGQLYLAAEEVGRGPDFEVPMAPLVIPCECKNEKPHTESPESVRRDILSRFVDYHKEWPKLLITSRVTYTREAMKLFDEHNVQILELPSDIETLPELEAILPQVEARLRAALYKFKHYERYLASFGPERNPGKNEDPRGGGSYSLCNNHSNCNTKCLHRLQEIVIRRKNPVHYPRYSTSSAASMLCKSKEVPEDFSINSRVYSRLREDRMEVFQAASCQMTVCRPGETGENGGNEEGS